MPIQYYDSMSRLTDEVARMRTSLQSANVPLELSARIASILEEAIRLESDITARIHIEGLLRYVDWVVHLPWTLRTKDAIDLSKVSEVLKRNHYGLDEVKDRILEYLAVLKLNGDHWTAREDSIDQKSGGLLVSSALLGRRAPILCLVGLVGTGKTTLAKSIAEAMGRRFVRIPFGGMSDALELRGQSRVRPDAEMGLILKGLRHAESKNPVMLLDEIDRVADHARGDIMGVLVELLDPEQNAAFTDHYVDYPFDLSQVLFIATANNTTHISTAVMDRLEPIQMPSYTDEEKIKIGKDYVFPTLLQSCGLSSQIVSIDDALWPIIVRPLGYDAGIRSLERTINAICRKIARRIVEGKGTSFHITVENIKEFIEVY